jgi:hypothetical protein
MGVDGSADTVWFAESLGNKIGIISVGPTLSITEMSVPTPNAGPAFVSADSTGRVWFTETGANKVGILSQGAIAEFAVPSLGSGLSGIVAEVEAGMAWFTERAANKVGSLTADGRLTEYAVPTPGSEPFGITRFQVEGQVIITERSGSAIARLQPDAAVVLAAQSAGGWTTEFNLANSENQKVTIFESSIFPPQRVCAGSCLAVISLQVPPLGSAKGTASQIDFGEFGPLFFRSLEDGLLPAVRARFANSDSLARSADIPLVRLSTIAALDPAVLVFPSASRTSGGGHSNLLVAEVSSQSFLRIVPDTGLRMLIEAFSSTGQPIGSLSTSVGAGGSVYLVDVLGQLGADQLVGGQLRLTRIGGGGIMWAYLITESDDGAIGISLGLTP